MARVRNMLIALDQFVYVWGTLGHGAPDETISSALWRTEQAGKIAGRVLRPVVDRMFNWIGQDDHCRKAFEAELRRKQLPSVLQV